MYVYIYICNMDAYIHIHIYIYIYIINYIHIVYIYAYIHIYMYTFMYIYTYVYIYKIYIYTHTCIHRCVYLHICIYQVLQLENTFVLLCNGPRPMPIIHYLVGDEHIQCQGMVPIPSQLCGGSPSQGLWILAWHEMNCVPLNIKYSSPRLSDFQFHCLNPAANRMNVDWDEVFVNQVR